MPSGLLALLDDVAAIVKANAIHLDDISAYATKASSKASGVVIDDAAVTPNYVLGLSPERELAIIWAIAKRSFFNKLCILTPAALFLGYFVPWLIQPILMIGAAYLCFEGYEKVHHMFIPCEKGAQDVTLPPPQDPAIIEKERVAGAVRTDIILSAEIIAITYAQLANLALLMQVIILVIVSVVITVGVYGVVALIVKADDAGLYLATHSKSSLVQAWGRGLVRVMPPFLALLSVIGTAAMLWVGGEIILHAVPPLHDALHHLQHSVEGNAVVAWGATVLCAAVSGLIVGWVVARGVNMWQKMHRHAR